jgi:hypothetical protein
MARCYRRLSASGSRIQLTRKDEMAWENYGLAFVIDQRVGCGQGRHDRGIGTTRRGLRTLGGRPGANSPGNVITAFSRFSARGICCANALRRIQPTLQTTTMRVPSYMSGSGEWTSAAGRENIRSERVLSHDVHVAAVHRSNCDPRHVCRIHLLMSRSSMRLRRR